MVPALLAPPSPRQIAGDARLRRPAERGAIEPTIGEAEPLHGRSMRDPRRRFIRTVSMSLHLERETFDKAVDVADGVWLLATRHRPGFSRMQPEMNNRVFVFRLTDQRAGEQVLFVANPSVSDAHIPEVRRLERETGLTVRYLFSPGGGHHLQIPPWRDAFTKATVLVGPTRVPKVASARRLMEGGRVQILDPANPLPQFQGELGCVIFDKLIGFPDMKTTYEGGKEGFFTPFKIMMEMMSMKDPCDELWLWHRATETVIGGENLGWILSEKIVAGFPFMMKMMMKPNSVYVQDKGRKVGDKEATARAWKQVLAWPCRTLLGYHEPPGEAFVGDGRAALEAAVKKVKQIA